VGCDIRVVLGDDDAGDTLGTGVTMHHVVLTVGSAKGATNNGGRYSQTHPALGRSAFVQAWSAPPPSC
jgi:hypothetical protein